MPLAESRDGTRIFFERHAPPGAAVDCPTIVALPVMGTSGRLYANAMRPGVEAGYGVVTIDHRGSGRSGPSQSWSTAVGADDVVAVLDELGIGRAHVSGASLGGMVAQEVALRHPARTAALVLFATTGGWPRLDLISSRATFRLAKGIFRARDRPLSLDSRVERAIGTWFSRDFAKNARQGDPAWEALRAIFEDMDEESPDSRRAQLFGALRHSSWRRLPQVGAPTLVQHGGADRLISWRSGAALARAIPQAEFHLWPRAGHALGLEIPESSYRLGLQFLSQHDHLIDPRFHRHRRTQ